MAQQHFTSQLRSTAKQKKRLPSLFLGGAILLSTIASAQAAAICTGSKTRIDRIDPLIGGHVAALQTAGHPADLTKLAFKKEDGSDITLADFKGKTLVLNLWATWCPPCKKEMPDLDELQAHLGGDDFEVVTVSLDNKAPAKPRAFFDERAIKNLELYYDPKKTTFSTLRKQGMAFGMPTTLVIDKEGCSLAHMSGMAPWAGKEAVTLLKAAMDDEAQ